MVRVAHRFGIRVYFDNIMNHNAFDVPGYNAGTSIETYPGFVPEDFHLKLTEDGFYRKWDNTRDWNDAWQVQNLGLADLIDIATEPGSTNFNHGSYEGDTIPKIKFIRHPDNPEYYCYDATGTYVGFGTGNGLTKAYLQEHPETYAERVEDMLHRAARWQLDRTKADGFRLDAVKHTPADFFGATYGVDKDSSDYGYLGQSQRQFNLTRGFSDSNHRDTVFNTENPRDDAMMFGEHLGQPPAYGSYIDAGMRLVDNDLRSNLNNVLGNPSSGLQGYQNPGHGGFTDSVAVMHAQSHDSDYAARRELQHAIYFTRAGLGLVYTDGNYHAETLGESGGAFPRHANTSFLGQWGDSRIPNLLKIHRDFVRGYQQGREGNSPDLISYERIDKRENAFMSDAAGATMLIAINDNYANGVALTGGTSFPSAPGSGAENNPNTGDEYLYQYARGYGSQVGFYKYASDLNSVLVPSGSYFVFAPRTPEESNAWKNAGGKPIIHLSERRSCRLHRRHPPRRPRRRPRLQPRWCQRSSHRRLRLSDPDPPRHQWRRPALRRPRRRLRAKHPAEARWRHRSQRHPPRRQRRSTLSRQSSRRLHRCFHGLRATARSHPPVCREIRRRGHRSKPDRLRRRGNLYHLHRLRRFRHRGRSAGRERLRHRRRKPGVFPFPRSGTKRSVALR